MRNKPSHIILLVCISLLILCTGSEPKPIKSSNHDEQKPDTRSEQQEKATGKLTPISYGLYIALDLVGSLSSNSVCIVVVFIVWKFKKGTILPYIFTVKNKDLAEKRTELRKQLQVTQEDLDAWAAALPPLMEVKRGLGNQKDEFKQQLEEIEKESEENKEKIQSVEKEIIVSDAERATERTEGLLRQKQNLLDAQWKLEKRQGEVEKQQLNVQKELQRTNDLITRMTERKRKLENRMEVNQTYLDEVDSQNDETRLHTD